MIINYLKGKGLTTKYNSFIYASIPDVHCTARGYYCQDYLKTQSYPEEIYSEGYANSDWSYPGATDDQIQNALSLEEIKSHVIKGGDYKDAEAYLKNLEDAVSKGSVCIACVNPKEYVDTKITSHWTVIYGYNNTHILLNDPGWGRFKKEHPISKSDFTKALWNAEPKSWRKAIIIDTSLEAKPVLASPLRITPEKDKYYVGDTLRAEFTIKNIGGAPITLDKLLVGGRFNDGKLPNGEYPDFTSQSTTLQTDFPYNYTGTLTLTHPSEYKFFIAYYIENPTSEEKKLLDENNWNTCIGLGEGLTDADRTGDISVFPQLEKNVLSVPDDHPTIQTAVDAANAGDTIIVRDGTYTENVDIDKSITLKSSSGNPEYTIVDAVDPYDHVFSVTADHVKISGFTVTEAPAYGIYLHNADYCDISDNICSHSAFGIYLDGSNSNSISDNTCFNNEWSGISLSDSENNTISNNTCSNNGRGIYLEDSENNSISNNLCCNNNSISNNLFYNERVGIGLFYSDYNTVSDNACSNNDLGILPGCSNNNRIYLNNFINNCYNVCSCESTNIWNSKEKITYSYNGESHTNYLGNHWSDYTGTDANKNGIGDSPYSIDDRGGDIDQDYYPLMKPFENYFELK